MYFGALRPVLQTPQPKQLRQRHIHTTARQAKLLENQMMFLRLQSKKHPLPPTSRPIQAVGCHETNWLVTKCQLKLEIGQVHLKVCTGTRHATETVPEISQSKFTYILIELNLEDNLLISMLKPLWWSKSVSRV